MPGVNIEPPSGSQIEQASVTLLSVSDRGAISFVPRSLARLTSGAILLVTALLAPGVTQAAEPLSASAERAVRAPEPGAEATVVIVVEIEEGWHINSATPRSDFLIPTRLTAELSEGLSLVAVDYPQPIVRKLEFASEPLELYEGEIRISARIRNEKGGAEPDGAAVLAYQACSDVVCKRPTRLKIPIRFETAKAPQPRTIVTAGFNDEAAAQIADLVAGGLWVVVPGMILLGLALNLTPCVYPLVSITVAYFGGQAGDSRARKILLALLYALGIAITFSAVGASAALSGGLFGAALTKPPVLIGMAAMMVGLALSSFGLYQIKIPDSLNARLGNAGHGAIGALIMGMTMGLVAAPCVGPVVVGLLVFVGSQGDVFLGLSLFFLLAVGLGLPYVILAVAAGSISALPRSGAWLEWTEHLFGCVLLAMAIYFVQPILPDNVEAVLMPGFLLLATVYLAFFDRAGSEIRGFLVGRRAAGVVAVALLVWTYLPSSGAHGELEFSPFSAESYDLARRSGRPLVIEFSAEWCLPCKEMEERTFTDREVVESGEGVTFLTVDMTTSTRQIDRILESFDVFGAPTTLFFGPDGKEWKRKVGFIGPDEFADLLEQSYRQKSSEARSGA